MAIPVVKRILSQNYPYFKFPINFDLPFCNVCVKSKLTSKVFDQVRISPTRPGKLITADLIGLIKPETYPHKYKFVLTVLYSYSNFARVFLLKSKSEIVSYLQTFFVVVRA